MTITSLSGSFRIEATRDGGRFEQVVVGTVGPRQTERRVRLTNDTVQEWQDGSSLELDEEGERLARAHVNARVFFPLLPYSLSGGDIRFEDLGLDTWHGRDLHKVKVTFNPGTSNDADDSYMFWFDPDSGRIEQFGSTLTPDCGTGRPSSSIASAEFSSPRRRTTRSMESIFPSTYSRRSMSPGTWSFCRPSCSPTSASIPYR